MTEFRPNATATVELPNDILHVDEQEEIASNDIALRQSPKVIALSQSLDINNANAVVEFGGEPAKVISTFADRVLDTVKKNSMQDSNKLMKTLSDIMRNFDRKDFESERGFLAKVIHAGKDTVQRMVSKYQTIGSELDKVTKEINNYKLTLNQSNTTLDELFQENFKYHQELEQYIVAGEMIVEELERGELPEYVERAKSGRQEDLSALDQLQTIIELVRDRVYNLRTALVVSEQTAPQIRSIQKTNYQLILKIHSAFIVTIPIFKISLLNAVVLKQQKNAAEGMKALDETTNQLLLETARRTSQQGVEIAKLSSQPGITAEVLEERQKIILQGIEDVHQIEQERSRNRDEGVRRLSQLRDNMRSTMQRMSK